jgi:hypothetical protein
MWVKATQTLIGNYGRKEAGEKFNVTKSYGEQLVKQGLAEEIESEDNSDPVETKPKTFAPPLTDKDVTDNSEPEEIAGTEPSPELKDEKDTAITKEEKGVKSTK